MIFGPDLVIVFLVLVVYVVPLWALIDACLLPNTKWLAAGKSKALWIALLAVTLIFEPIGLLLAIGYFSLVRRNVKSAETL